MKSSMNRITTKSGDVIVFDDDTAKHLLSPEFGRVLQRKTKTKRTAPPIALVALAAILCWLLALLG